MYPHAVFTFGRKEGLPSWYILIIAVMEGRGVPLFTNAHENKQFFFSYCNQEKTSFSKYTQLFSTISNFGCYIFKNLISLYTPNTYT